MKYCKQCGVELDKEAEFCRKCGFQTKKSKNTPRSDSETNPKNKKSISWIAAVLLFLTAGALAIMNYESWFGSNDTNDSVNEQNTSLNEDENTSITTDEDEEQTRLTNSKYGFSIDAGEAIDNMSEVLTDLGNALDSYAYCYKLEPADTYSGGSGSCAEGSRIIFYIQVMNAEQYEMMNIGELLDQYDDYYFVYTHINGFPPESLPVDFFEDVAASFELDESVISDIPDLLDNAAAELLQDLHELVETSALSPDDLIPWEFEWHVAQNVDPTGIITVDGMKLSIWDVKIADDATNEYFQDQGFVSDLYNEADGAGSNLVGFQKDSMVCLILRTYIEQEVASEDPDLDDTDFEYTHIDIEISCGELEI